MCYKNMGMGCVANHNDVLETAVLIVHFQTTHIEPEKEGLHIPIQGDDKSLIIINIEEHFSMSTGLVSGIFNNDLSRCLTDCYFCVATLITIYHVATFAIHRYLTRTAHPFHWWNLVLAKTN
jgi:hypothetical protein